VSGPPVTAEASAGRAELDPSTLWHVPIAELSERLRGWDEGGLRRALGHDPWLHNIALSVWERDHQRAEVASLPWHQSFVIVEHCNARCAFCSYWLNSESVIDQAVFERLRPVLRFARTLVLTGGEPTLHPNLPKLLERFASWTDERCFRSIITNGLRLPELARDLERLRFNVSVSLNAATAETHHRIMRLGPDALPGIVRAIGRLKDAGRYVSVSFVVTTDSLAEVPAFLRICEDVGADLVYLRTPTPLGAGSVAWDRYAELAPSLHPDFERLHAAALEAIARARVPVDAVPEQWAVATPMGPDASVSAREMRDFVRGERPTVTTRGLPVPGASPFEDEPLDAPYGREAPLGCDHVYFSLAALGREHRLEPCCFMPAVPGHEPVGLLADDDFSSLWNAPAMMALRRRLGEGPLFPMCKACTYNRLGY
jgi:MoaA/NifB/PqqE/SkfB family radical SAM enzyme